MTDSMPPFASDNDPDVRRTFEWMRSLIDPNEWQARVNAIETELERAITPGSGELLKNSISIDADRVGWYLYLAHTALFDITKFEPAQGAHVIPVFKALGSDLVLLRDVGGVEGRVARMLHEDRRQPDSIILELLVALLWRKNGFTADFIEESPTEKRPDIVATRDSETWYIECKRLQQSSDYTEEERAKWLSMWRHLREFLFARSYPCVLDFTFHIPLDDLPEDFLVAQLADRLPNSLPATIFDNETWTVRVDAVDDEAIQQHLERYKVKYPGSQFNELIGGYIDSNRGFTCAFEGVLERIGEGIGNNRFVSELGFAIGAFWSCDANSVLERKARDIRSHVAKAVQQLPAEGNTAIHVALETMDGPAVESLRHARIQSSMRNFQFGERPVPWLYCHALQSYSPPNGYWVIDESDWYFGPSANSPLNNRSIIVPPEYQSADQGVHWLTEPP